LPGFVESHLHLVLGGRAGAVAAGRGGGVRGAGAAFRAYAAKNPDLPLLMAQGAAYEILDHPVTRHDLDRVILPTGRSR
jgi:predicted amidohydrolase YtcJ